MIRRVFVSLLLAFEFCLCALPPVEIPITVEILNKSLADMSKAIMDNVTQVISTNEAASVAALKQEIQAQQLLEEANNLKRFKEMEELIKALSNACTGKPTGPETSQQMMMAIIMPIFMRQLRCGSCCGCSRGDICLFYLFMYVIPLLGQTSTTNGQSGLNLPNLGSAELNKLLQSIMGNTSGGTPTIPSGLFPQQPNLTLSGLLNTNNLLGAGCNNNPLMQMLSMLFSQNGTNGTNAQAGRCCPPPYGPVPPIIPPIDPYGPLPPIDPYGPVPPCCELPQQAGVQTREFGSNFGRKY